MSERQMTCALWVWRHGSLCVDLYATEVEAISSAAYIEDEGSGSVSGVQFSDGRYIKVDDWTALQDYLDAEMARWRAENERQKNQPSPPKRTIRAPFDDRFGVPITTTIVGDVPSWVGWCGHVEPLNDESAADPKVDGATSKSWAP